MEIMFAVILGLLTAVWIRNILFGNLLKMVDRAPVVDPEIWPTINVVVPVFNEGAGVYGTLKTLASANYPADKFNVTVVDDCSTDDTYTWVERAIKEFSNINIRLLRQTVNQGKQKALLRGFHEGTNDIFVAFDSDVRVEPNVLRSFARELIADKKLGIVGASCGIYNANDNLISQGYTTVFYSMHEWLKQVESATGCVSVIDGKAIGVRREVYAEVEPVIKQNLFLGLHMMAGEDRHLTHQLTLLGYNSKVVLERVCTSSPPTLVDLYKQQLRWRRSGMRDFFQTLSSLRMHMMKLGPLKTTTILLSRATYTLIPFVYMWIAVTGGIVSILSAQLTFFMFVICLRVALNAHAWMHQRDQFVNNIFFSSLVLSCWMTVDLVLTTPMAVLTLDEGGWGTRNLSFTAKKEVSS